jgi:hypothetical protein
MTSLNRDLKDLCLSSLGVDILDVNLREQYLMAFQEALE